MKAIIACDANGGIGYQNKLPWSNIQGDLPRFKRLTENQVVVMGRNTWDSLPKKPLPNRVNYVLTSKALDNVITISDPYDLDNNAWIIGGAKVIESCWDLINELHLTRTFAEYTCDTFIDLVKLQNDFMCQSTEYNIDHRYEVWKRK